MYVKNLHELEDSELDFEDDVDCFCPILLISRTKNKTTLQILQTKCHENI